jgi:predicted secreted Zn-dependent protease
MDMCYFAVLLATITNHKQVTGPITIINIKATVSFPRGRWVANEVKCEKKGRVHVFQK